MVYKNFFLRLIISIFFISSYLLLLFIDFKSIPYLIFLIYLFILIEIVFYFKNYKIIPIIYIIISFIFFYNLDFNHINIYQFNLFIFIIFSFDTFSYIVGKIFGKNKLTKISPNKTIEGFFGGASISIILSIIFSIIINFNINYKLILFILIIILSSFLGDIFESYFKRKNNLKNASEIIPGHGGVFDRFDSFLFSIIIYSIFINI